MAPANAKQHAHELIDRMPLAQVSAIVQMIEAMLDPVSRAIANAPLDDEPESEAERQAVAASKAWLEKHPVCRLRWTSGVFEPCTQAS